MQNPVVFTMPDDDVLEEAPVAGNYDYRDMRGTEWVEVEEAVAHDCVLITMLEKAHDVEETLDQYRDRFLDDVDDERRERFERYAELDPGVACAVLALSAAGAAPVASCNGGIFGDPHQEMFPLICFVAPQTLEAVITESARASGLILEQNRITKTPVLSSLEIRPFVKFAERMLAARPHA